MTEDAPMFAAKPHVHKDLLNLETYTGELVTALRLKYRKISVVRGVSFQLVIEDFGVIVCGINRSDYTEVSSMINIHFAGWRVVYITTKEAIYEKKEEIIWALMRSGYLTYIRAAYPRQFNNLITIEGFGNKIIRQRLAIWGDAPKYKWLVEENEAALRESDTYILSVNSGFYDYMPEYVEKITEKEGQ